MYKITKVLVMQWLHLSENLWTYPLQWRHLSENRETLPLTWRNLAADRWTAWSKWRHLPANRWTAWCQWRHLLVRFGTTKLVDPNIGISRNFAANLAPPSGRSMKCLVQVVPSVGKIWNYKILGTERGAV